jgi:hypothetical protein
MRKPTYRNTQVSSNKTQIIGSKADDVFDTAMKVIALITL